MLHHEKLDYLEAQVTKNIAKAKKYADRNKLRMYAFSISSAILGTLVTIALGLQTESFATLLKNLALIFGAIIAVVNTVESVFGFRSLWVKQKVTLLRLYALKNEIDFYKAGMEENDKISERKVVEFFRDYQGIWETASSEWLRLETGAAGTIAVEQLDMITLVDQ